VDHAAVATAIPQTAARRDTKSALIRVRVTPVQRSQFARAARTAGLDLSSWLRSVALSASTKRVK